MNKKKLIVIIAAIATLCLALVACAAIDGIRFEKEPRTTYVQGQDIDLQETVLVAFTGEKTKPVDLSKVEISGYDKNTLGEQTVSFTYEDKTITLKINGEYYMPLAINWYGTQPNNVTDMLVTAWQANPNATTAIGAYITYTSCDFTTGLYGEYLQIEAYGWDGVAKLCAINFATGFTSAAYDFSFGWTLDQDMYADYSQYYIMDEADFWENY